MVEHLYIGGIDVPRGIVLGGIGRGIVIPGRTVIGDSCPQGCCPGVVVRDVSLFYSYIVRFPPSYHVTIPLCCMSYLRHSHVAVLNLVVQRKLGVSEVTSQGRGGERQCDFDGDF